MPKDCNKPSIRSRLRRQAWDQVDLFLSNTTTEVTKVKPPKLLLLYIVRELNGEQLDRFIREAEKPYENLLDRTYGQMPPNHVEEVFQIKE